MTFDISKEYILENDRVLLRPLTIEDIGHLAHFSINEPSLWDYSLLPGNGLENLNTYIKSALDAKIAGNAYPFIVWDKREKQYAGSTRFYDIQPTHNTLQLGFTWYGKDFQRTGLNKNCKLLMLSFAFENLGVDRVEFRADTNNQISIAAMKSIGCKVEGVLRSNCASPDGRRDSIILSILKSEWENGVKTALVKQI